MALALNNLQRVDMPLNIETKPISISPKGNVKDRLGRILAITSRGLPPINILVKSKVGDLCWGWPEGSLFNSYYTEL